MRIFNILVRGAKIPAVAAVIFLVALGVAAQPGGLKGKVRSNSGTGISNAAITLTKGSDDVKSTRSSADGSFQIAGIEPGFYGLRVDADGYASGSLFSVEVKKGKVRDLGDRLFLKVDQGRQVILRGSVFFREGTSVNGAKVELERVGADGSVKRVGSTESSMSGEFIFRQPEGAAKYRIKATYKGVSAVKEIEVENAALYRLAVSLDLSGENR